ncbi:MAG: TlpA family protein disulfide reductase [Gammaproteobacteria bacterium]|nr:TlpA family protein disulfide reductase [Gammaproteobacteria bacterium]MDH5650757.1 TlpA family protein disulfide reductase [Gammaproteobacteria bacterium]
MTKTKPWLYLSCVFLLSMNVHAQSLTLPFSTEVELTADITPGKGKVVLLWLPSEHGPQAGDAQLVKALGKSGIEVWRIDLFEANFLPVSAGSLDQIPAEQVGFLISDAHKRTGKTVFIFTSGRGVIPVLRGARHWQKQHAATNALRGVILQNPKFYEETPDPGEEGKLMPIVSATNLPIYILQPDLSPWFWKLPQPVAALEQGGSDVFVQRLKGVRGRYHYRPDANAFEQGFTNTLPALIRQAAWLLDTLPATTRQAVQHIEAAPPVRIGKKDHALTKYKSDPTPPPLILPDLHGKPVDLRQLRGEVLLVNFWASWCPPCVQEMPSMERLAKHFKGKPFRILAVNMAEDKQTINNFIRNKVRVNFPILLDQDGKALREWRVFAFPTSYVVDREGRIRYAVFGSIEWDSKDVIAKLTALQE